MWQEEVNRLENTDQPWQAIIFVERRMAACALWQLLSTCPILDFLSCQVLMGQGGDLQSATHTFKVSASKHGTHRHPVCPGTRSWQQSDIHCIPQKICISIGAVRTVLVYACNCLPA